MPQTVKGVIAMEQDAPVTTTPADDIEAIRQLKARYFRTLDQKDWSGYRQVFTDDVEIDVTDDAADGCYAGTEIYLPMIESLLGTATTVHRGGQAEITVGGDTASGIWAMDDRIWFPGGATLIGSGWYEETYRRTADGWLIAAMRLRRHRVELDGVVIFPTS